MRVALISLWHDGSDPETWIGRDTLRRELSRELSALGHVVTVIQEGPRAARVQDGPVEWRFVPAPAPVRAARAAFARSGRDDAIVKIPSPHVLRPTAAFRPDVLHSFDLVHYPTLALLGRLARSLDAALVAHFQGGAPARWGMLRAVERRALAGTHRLLFTTRERGQQWVASGALPDDHRIAQVFESSSTFTPGPAPRLPGRPALLHVGRLDPVKDPLTTIEGLRRALPRLPEAHLTMVWRDGPMEAAVRQAAAGLPVTFRGTASPAEMEALYRGADALVQASVREVSSYALMEAVACGTPTVLTDIPSLRALTGQGRTGPLFPVGRPDALAEALASPLPSRAEVRAWFDEALAFPVLARQIAGIYESCLQEIRATG